MFRFSDKSMHQYEPIIVYTPAKTITIFKNSTQKVSIFMNLK